MKLLKVETEDGRHLKGFFSFKVIILQFFMEHFFRFLEKLRDWCVNKIFRPEICGPTSHSCQCLKHTCRKLRDLAVNRV